jgi:hypothetical protein
MWPPDKEKMLYAVMIGDTGNMLCITDDEDTAKRVAWTYDTYTDLMAKAKARDNREEYDELIAARRKILKEWKFGIYSNDMNDKTKVVTIPMFQVPVQLVKGFMDAYTLSKYKAMKNQK